MRAERLRFHEPPDTEVRFHGTPGRESVSRSRRWNLPDPVTEGVDHEDVRVDYRLASRLRQPSEGEAATDPEADQAPDTEADPERGPE